MTGAKDQAPPADHPRGTLGMSDDGQWEIRFQRRLRHAPERVWAALADPAEQASWIPGVTIDAKVGGKVLFDFDEEGKAEGEVLAVDEPHTLVHTWWWPGEPEATVRWELTPDGDGTLLALLHNALRKDPAVDYAAGWHAMLDALPIHLDGGNPSDFLPNYEHLFALYAAEVANT